MIHLCHFWPWQKGFLVPIVTSSPDSIQGLSVMPGSSSTWATVRVRWPTAAAAAAAAAAAEPAAVDSCIHNPESNERQNERVLVVLAFSLSEGSSDPDRVVCPAGVATRRRARQVDCPRSSGSGGSVSLLHLTACQLLFSDRSPASMAGNRPAASVVMALLAALLSMPPVQGS